MLITYYSTVSSSLILFFIVNALFSISNSNANLNHFNGYCTDSFNQCQHVCIPNPTKHRQFHCTCRSGFFIQHDGFSCKKTPPKNLEMDIEINSEPVVKTDRNAPKNSILIKKSTKRLVTREKRYTDGKSKTIKPIKGLPKGKCSHNSCKNGGVCQTMKATSRQDFVISCLCRLGFEGQFCEKTTTGVKFPKFLNGYLAFPEQILNELNFRLSLYVRPANDSQSDTVIAFKQSMKANNFILGLEKNGFLFRIETAKSQKYIRHQNKINISRNKWYKVEIERKDNFAKLSVDNLESSISPIEVSYGEDEKYQDTRNEGSFPSNNFICDYCLYLGGHPQMIKMLRKNVHLFDSIENSFIGCMRNLVIDETDIDMRRMPFYGKAVDGLGIEDCSTSLCQSKKDGSKCQNNGDCQISNDFETICQCTFGFSGKYCEKDIKIQMPSFTGESFANYHGLIGTSRSHNDIFIQFKPISGTGLLLYQGYSSDKRGDFLALFLINGYPMVSYDLGSGAITMRGLKSLSLDEWHTIRFYRIGRQGSLFIDHSEPIVGYSPGSQLQLTMKQNLQLGGVDNFDNVSAFLSIHKGFKGCINLVIVDNKKIDLIKDLINDKSRNLQNCDSHQCGNIRRTCWPIGDCIPVKERYFCSCPLGYIEGNCQTKIETSGIRHPLFNGSSYLIYNDTMLLKKFLNSKFTFSIVVNLRIVQNERVLVQLISKSEMNLVHYFSIMINKKGEMSVNINNGVDKSETVIMDNVPLLSDNKIQINKDEEMIHLSTNNTLVKSIKLQYEKLSVFGFTKLFIGGTDILTAISFNLPIQSGIVGCVKEINIDNQIIKVINATDGRSVAECSSRFSSNPDSLDKRSEINKI